MAIINKIIKTEGGISFYEIYNNGLDYLFCTHSPDFVIYKTTEPIVGKTQTRDNIFGADTLNELNEEIIRLGLMETISSEQNLKN